MVMNASTTAYMRTAIFVGVVVALALLVPSANAQLPSFNTTNAISSLSSRGSRALAVVPRANPLDNFKEYKQGFKFKDEDYWASLFFTGVAGYAIGAIVLLAGILHLIVRLICVCCCGNGICPQPRKDYTYASWQRVMTKALILLLTVATIGGAAVLYVGNSDLDSALDSAIKTIVQPAATSSAVIKQYTDDVNALAVANNKQNIPGMPSNIYNVQTALARINSDLAKLTKTTKDVEDTFNEVKHVVIISLLVISITFLALVALGSIASIMNWATPLAIILSLGFLVCAVTWIVFGVFFALANFSDDLCQALAEHNTGILIGSGANSDLNDLIQCPDSTNALALVQAVDYEIARSIAGINMDLLAANAGAQPGVVPSGIAAVGKDWQLCDTKASTIPRYGTSGSSVPYNCNQVINGTTTQYMPYTEFDFLRPLYRCATNAPTCYDAYTIPSYVYDTDVVLSGAASTVDSSQQTVTNVVLCRPVNDMYQAFEKTQCTPMKDAFNLVWIGMLIGSVGLIFSLICWEVTRLHAISFKMEIVEPGPVEVTMTSIPAKAGSVQTL